MSSELKKYLQSRAFCQNADETFIEYLGRNSNSSDHRAFLDYLQTEYLTNGKYRLSKECAIECGVFSLLDGMTGSSLRGRPPMLEYILDDEAYHSDGDRATYDIYLGSKRCKAHEQEFRQKLYFLWNKFNGPVDEDRAFAVAKYMMGDFKNDSGDDDEEEQDVISDSENEQEDNDDNDNDNDNDDDDDDEEKKNDRKHKSNEVPVLDQRLSKEDNQDEEENEEEEEEHQSDFDDDEDDDDNDDASQSDEEDGREQQHQHHHQQQQHHQHQRKYR